MKCVLCGYELVQVEIPHTFECRVCGYLHLAIIMDLFECCKVRWAEWYDPMYALPEDAFGEEYGRGFGDEAPPFPILPNHLNYWNEAARAHHSSGHLYAIQTLKFHPGDILDGKWQDWFLWSDERLQAAGYAFINGRTLDIKPCTLEGKPCRKLPKCHWLQTNTMLKYCSLYRAHLGEDPLLPLPEQQFDSSFFIL